MKIILCYTTPRMPTPYKSNKVIRGCLENWLLYYVGHTMNCG